MEENVQQEIEGGPYSVYSWQDLHNFLQTPVGRYVGDLEEKHYRRGYFDGVYQAAVYINRGADHRQLNWWINEILWNWRYRDIDKCIEPPCVYCGQEATTVDHIVPLNYYGGGYEKTNLVAACRSCNSTKKDRTPSEAKMDMNYLPDGYLFDGDRLWIDGRG
jgi:5-methylcytosine-specific restriction endonuclease McrA